MYNKKGNKMREITETDAKEIGKSVVEASRALAEEDGLLPIGEFTPQMRVIVLEEALHKVRARLGDFDKEWSEREEDVDKIAKYALYNDRKYNEKEK